MKVVLKSVGVAALSIRKRGGGTRIWEEANTCTQRQFVPDTASSISKQRTNLSIHQSMQQGNSYGVKS
jgi:hypothetical protein